MARLISTPCRRLEGAFDAPGDKSISHRALMLGALAVGETRIHGLLEGEDVLATARAMRAFGATVEAGPPGGVWRVHGLGVGGLLEPDGVIDFANAGTGIRLCLGLAATTAVRAFFTGDHSLRRRPMGRVIEPLTAMGARFEACEGGRLPLLMDGAADAIPIEYRLPVASAQVKSAVLLAGLNAPGETTVVEPARTRDHTENMLRHFGADLRLGEADDGARRITVAGEAELWPAEVQVPGDPSSAAFPVVAALIAPQAEVLVCNVGLNPTRAALFDTLREMGAEIVEENRRTQQHEPVADLRVRAGRLRGVAVPPERAPAMIDEYPVLAVAAAYAEGPTEMRGIAELRVKESDRIAMMARGLAALGVPVQELDDGLIVGGRQGGAPGRAGVIVETAFDHRIAMSFLVFGVGAAAPLAIDDDAAIGTSFPGFAETMNALGAGIDRPEADAA